SIGKTQMQQLKALIHYLPNLLPHTFRSNSAEEHRVLLVQIWGKCRIGFRIHPKGDTCYLSPQCDIQSIFVSHFCSDTGVRNIWNIRNYWPVLFASGQGHFPNCTCGNWYCATGCSFGKCLSKWLHWL
uniref:Uncharacterized protein n=1 Tax=Melopsittacus undulatus TaxID=13146 RepID=A0A8C6IUX9_MELUD